MLKKRFVLIFLILFSSIILYNLGRQIADALNSGKRLDREVDVLTNLQQENQKLRDKLALVSSYSFVEQAARDKLDLSKPDETMVIIPKEAIDNILGSEKVHVEVKLPNWQGWLKLIFH